MRDIRLISQPLSDYSSSWALVIGINKYQHASPLEYAVNDAQSVATILKEQFSFPDDHVKLLLDTHASRQAIMDAYADYANSHVGPNDRVLLFFAGHGHTINGLRGEVGFLIPCDGDPTNIASLIRWDELTRDADLIRAKHIFFVMDACYSGLALKRGGLLGGSVRFIRDTSYRTVFQITDDSQIKLYTQGCETKKSKGERDDCHQAIS